MVDILAVVADKGDFITEIIVRQFGITATIAKCYLRQLTEYGYRGSHDGCYGLRIWRDMVFVWLQIK